MGMAARRQESEVNIELHPKQMDALHSIATEILYGGAAGGGKSHLMRSAAITWATAINGLQVYIFRRLSPDLIKNHMEGPQGFRAMLAPWVEAGIVRIVEEEIRFWNGSKIFLCHCKDEKDKYKYLGTEMHVLLIDELTHFPDSIYRFLRSRVRMVGITVPEEWRGRFPRIVCGSNPGNIGHLWVKQAFIDNCNPMAIRQMPANEGGMLRQFIPARLQDNPSMERDDPGYADKLAGLGSAALVKAMKDGDWNVIDGAFFDGWSTARHVIRPFTIPAHWTRFGSFDWGSAKPFSMGWWAVSDGSVLPSGHRFPTGSLIRYREWYGAKAPNVGLKMTVEAIADGILEREKGETVTYRVADPACWKADGGPSHVERMAAKGLIFRPADNSRVTGWDQVRTRLDGDGEEPMLYVFDTCADFIRTFPALQHDTTKPEDVDTDMEDHAADEARYACMSRPITRKASVQTPLRGAPEMTMGEAWNLCKIAAPGGRRI